MTHCTQNKLSAIQFFLSCELCGGAVACLSLYLPLNKKSTRRHFDNILTNFALNRLWSEASVSFIISFLNKKWCLTLKFFDMWKIQLQVWSIHPSRGGFFSERSDAFVFSPNRLIFIFYSKWLKSCQIRTWSYSNAFFEHSEHLR